MIRASIIIPFHNDYNTISRAIKSCIVQSEKSIEIIIISNGSNDEKRIEDMIDSFGDNRIILQKKSYSNRSKARNQGLNIASGKYIQLLDSDDFLEKNKIKMSCDFLDTHLSYKAYISSTKYVFSETNRPSQISKKFDPNIISHNTIEIGSVVFRNENIIQFDEQISFCEDWLFWVLNLKRNDMYFDPSFVGINKVISNSNTMSNLNEMIFGSFKVREIIKKEKLSHLINLKYYRYKYIEMFEIIEFKIRDKTEMIKLAPVTWLLCIIALKIPILNKKILIKIYSIKSKYIYQ